MNIKISLALLALAMPFAAWSDGGVPTLGTSQMPAESRDAAFIKQAGAGGLAEVELSRMAVSSAASPAVRRFAQEMVDAHTANNKELMLVAARQQITLPAQMDAQHARLKNDLEALHGADFDRAYLDAMVSDHEKMASLLEGAQSTSSNADVKRFARTTLPVVHHHLEMAQAIHRR